MKHTCSIELWVTTVESVIAIAPKSTTLLEENVSEMIRNGQTKIVSGFWHTIQRRIIIKMSQSRIHDQIVDLISKSHSTVESIQNRIQSLQQATELMLYHSMSNDQVDEFLETFLSLQVNREVPLRRFCAHFIEMLCYTRSRYACSCLEVLVTLLQDSDKQVQLFALRAARVVYKRALYWISIQQKESLYVEAARESVDALDHVLARIVHLITSSSKEVFCEAIRCAQSVILCQSFSTFAAKSQAQLEAAGCSSLEDLKLLEASSNVLEESKLKGQADRLFTALCALLVKKREESSADIEVVSLVRAVGSVGHQRPSYAAAATVAFSQLADELRTDSTHPKIRSALVSELKRILSSRHCVVWQPRIIPMLEKLGLMDLNVVINAEVERLRDQADTEQGLENPQKRRRKMNLDEMGERLMAISETADHAKVPDETQAESIMSVRAESPADLAKYALNLLGKLPQEFADPMAALIRVNRAGASSILAPGTGSMGFETRVKAARAMDLRVSDFLGPDANGESTDVLSDEEMESGTEESEGETTEQKHRAFDMAIKSSGANGNVDLADLAGLVASAKPHLFPKLLASLRGASRASTVELLRFFLSNHASNTEAVKTLFVHVYKSELSGEDSGITTEMLGEMLVASNPSIHDMKHLIANLPIVPESVLDYIDSNAASTDASTRRTALMVLASLVTSRPGIAVACLERLLHHCACADESARTDALKLLLAKVYKPVPVLLSWQWPYSGEKATVSVKESIRGTVSMLEYVCGEVLEAKAREGLEQSAANGDWKTSWAMLALCSKKPKLIHSILATIMENIQSDASIPGDVMHAFSQSLIALPGDVIDAELEVLVKHFKSLRAVAKKKHRNEFLLPILSAMASTERGLTGNLADAALSLRK